MENSTNFVEVLSQIMPRNNGNLKGFEAIVISQGRTAAINGQSIFDCPYEAGSIKAGLWMDGYQSVK